MEVEGEMDSNVTEPASFWVGNTPFFHENHVEWILKDS